MKYALFFLISSIAFGGQVIDLGRMEIRCGKVRGPEVQLIDPSELNDKSAQRIAQLQLSELEKQLLKHTPPPSRGREGK